MTYTLRQQAATIVGAVELYEFDFGENVVEYYTSARRPYRHDWGLGDGEVEYKPLPIKRSSLKSAGNLASDSLTIGLPTRPTFVGLLGKGAVSTLQVRIIRGFGPLTTATEPNFLKYWFIGNLSDINVTRTKTLANLRTLEYIFRETQVPRPIFQGTCNHDVFGFGCAIPRTDFQFTFDLRETLEDATLIRVNINPVTQDPSGSKSYDPVDHVQAGDGRPDPPLLPGFGGIGFYTLGQVWRDSLPEAPRHIMAHIYDPGDGPDQCRFKIMAPLPSLGTDRDYEAASNNLALSSEEFNASADWTIVNSLAVTLYDVPGPFFATKAAKLEATASGSLTRQVIASGGFIPSATYTCAIWIKKGDSLETDIILSNVAADSLRAKIEWAGNEQPFITIVSEAGAYIGIVPTIVKVTEDNWYLFSFDFEFVGGDGDVTLEIEPDSDSGGAFDKNVYVYAVMVKNGTDLVEYEANQTIWVTASFGCAKTGFACGTDKFNNLDNLLKFSEQPSVNPVIIGFRKP